VGLNSEKALLSNDLETACFESSEIAADLNQLRAICVLKGRAHQKRHRPPPEKTSGLSSDNALYPQNTDFSLIRTQTFLGSLLKNLKAGQEQRDYRHLPVDAQAIC
jgi:hypothetical protein